LLQKDTPALCRALLAAGFEVMIETNGSLSIKDIPTEVRRIVDCKLPDSGMGEYMLTENYDLLTPRDEVKFVVSSRRDFDYAVDVCCRYDLFSKTPNLLVSPVWGKYEFKELAQWVIEAKLPLRLQLQFHKIIWGDMPGV
jgi:7-carboxy-7-deazaguanine synthase